MNGPLPALAAGSLTVTDPFAVVCVLLIIEGGIFLVAQSRPGQRFFSILPAMFWIYFLPSLASNLGLIPSGPQAVYKDVVRYFLLPALLLLLVSVDLGAIRKLGGKALALMLSGSVGIILGGLVALLAFQSWLPANAWTGFGALSGSWIGGSANMIAVSDALGTPPNVFSPMVVVDIVVGYGWMAIVLALAPTQARVDRWNRADTTVVVELDRRLAAVQAHQARPITLGGLTGMIALAAGGTWFSRWAGGRLPEANGVISHATWGVLIVTALGVLLSQTPVRRLESQGASKLGYALLYFVLAAIGAQADLSSLAQSRILIAAGAVWIAIHASCLLLAARLLRAPMFLAATASQANVGGPASAPVVAAAYQPALATVGLLMAVVGNLIGTYLGIACGQLCRLVPWLYGMK